MLCLNMMHITDFNREEGKKENLVAPAQADRAAFLTQQISHSPSPQEQPPGKIHSAAQDPTAPFVGTYPLVQRC